MVVHRVAVTIEVDAPATQRTCEVVAVRVNDLQLPDACRGFAPVFRGGKHVVEGVRAGEGGVAARVVLRNAGPVHQHRRRSVRPDQLDDQVAWIDVGQADPHLDVFDLDTVVRYSQRARHPVRVAVGDGPVDVAGGRRRGQVVFVIEDLLGDPVLGKVHRRPGVDFTEAVVTGKMHAAAIPVGGPISKPGSIRISDLFG